MEDLIKIITGALVGMLMLLIMGCFGGIFVYFLWNWLMPTIFGLPIITFWQAVGLSWLSAFLTRGTGSSK